MKTHLIHLLVASKEYMLPCFSKQLFGMDCPGCGFQRSILFLLEGKFVEAFKMYPAIYPMLFLFGFLLFNKFYKVKHDNQIIIFLMISTVVLILGNFFLKFL